MFWSTLSYICHMTALYIVTVLYISHEYLICGARPVCVECLFGRLGSHLAKLLGAHVLVQEVDRACVEHLQG